MITKERIQKAKSKLGPFRICFIGDNDEVERKNRKQLIKYYTQYVNALTNNKNKGKGKQEYNDYIEDLEIINASEKNEDIIYNCFCLLIVFDMNNLNSFDNILDTWLIWLRETCKYANTIGIIGNYANDPASIHYRITNEEVYDLMMNSETSFIYTPVGELSKENKGKAINDLVNDILKKNKPKVIENDGKGCVIF